MAKDSKKPASRANDQLSNLILEGGRSQRYKSGQTVGRDAKTGQFVTVKPTVWRKKKA
jgi:hypothetical protein